MNKKALFLFSFFVLVGNGVYASCKTIFVNGSTIRVKQGDIIQNNTDVIVNPANSRLLQGGGLCGQIFMQSQDKGKLLTKECKKALGENKECEISDVILTDACGLGEFKKIFHVVPPNFNEKNLMQGCLLFDKKGKELLGKCYEKILNKAVASGVRSVSIPFLSAGNFSRTIFDLPEMAAVAIESMKKFCKSTKVDLSIDFVCFDEFTYGLVAYPTWSKLKLVVRKLFWYFGKR